MSFAAVAVICSAGTILLGLAATHPLELRELRWLKIGLSVPIVILVASVFYELHPIKGYFAMFGIGVLGFIWKTPMAHALSGAFIRLAIGDMHRPTGIRAEFGAAKALRKHGDLDDAIQQAKQELDKEPSSYEGLLLLAELYEETNQPNLAVQTLETLLRIGALSRDQRSSVAAKKEKIEERLVVARLNAR